MDHGIRVAHQIVERGAIFEIACHPRYALTLLARLPGQRGDRIARTHGASAAGDRQSHKGDQLPSLSE